MLGVQGSSQENFKTQWVGMGPHQPFWLPNQRNMDIEGMGAAMLKGPGENTGIVHGLTGVQVRNLKP